MARGGDWVVVNKWTFTATIELHVGERGLSFLTECEDCSLARCSDLFRAAHSTSMQFLVSKIVNFLVHYLGRVSR
ncbi:hypothetical protein BT69DRAFT_1281182 [Atractiella rhizophila]|nr:hypothetical protein BT69DRAFT_1288928 [Atractiella rhizophila]KAH8923760.1 hypothetical protein BT69DRAFT_1281182 [Atractiella rhizophila]